MDIMTYDEITSILAMHGRRDLIIEFQDNVKVDEDYKPPKRVKKEVLSDSEGSATEESLEFEVDEEGFMSLK